MLRNQLLDFVGRRYATLYGKPITNCPDRQLYRVKESIEKMEKKLMEQTDATPKQQDMFDVIDQIRS